MSGSSSASVVMGGDAGGGGYHHAFFTPTQWQELNDQAMIYKYLVAGLQVPQDLVLPIRRSFEALSSRFFPHPSLGSYCSYNGKKFDPEPGRCRRTDGKKWRCSKEAHPDSKYCERHMHRGRNRSRKPVESQSSTLSNNNNNNNNGNNGGSFYQNVPSSYEKGGFCLEASGSFSWDLMPSPRVGLTTASEAEENLSAMMSEQTRQMGNASNENLFLPARLSISTPRNSSGFSSKNRWEFQ